MGGRRGWGRVQAYGGLIECPIFLASRAKQTFQGKTNDPQSTRPAFCGSSLRQRICLNSSVRFGSLSGSRTPYIHTCPPVPTDSRTYQLPSHLSLPARSVPHCLKCPWSFFAVRAFLLFSKPSTYSFLQPACTQGPPIPSPRVRHKYGSYLKSLEIRPTRFGKDLEIAQP